MSASEVFGLGERAVARRTDPETSHEAAESVKDISDLQRMIWDYFELWGPHTDEAMYEAMNCKGWVSPSGFRSRRAELVAKGLLEFSGDYGRTKAGRISRIWRAVKG